ncbi:MAG: hypothetical protein WCR30_02945 [Clostridia bacterium]
MEKQNIFHSIKCDMQGCNNFACSSFVLSDKKSEGINLCSSCIKGMYELISKEIVPKSIPNPLKKLKKIEKRREEK